MTAPEGSELGLAKAPAGPTVAATNPASAPRDTTIDVHVLGSGFDQGSSAEFALGGVVGADVRTNSTLFVSSQDLVANITISAEAAIAFYDVVVTTSRGKKGIGTERFYVRAVNDIGTLGGSQAIAYDVNSAGLVAGKSLTLAESGFFAFIWSPVSGINPLPVVGGSTYSHALSINDLGVAVGVDEGIAAVWTPNGTGGYTEQRLGTFGGPTSAAWGINRDGVVIGHAEDVDVGYTPVPFRWTSEAGMQRLGLVEGYPTGINAVGTIVGYSGSDAFVWTEPEGPRFLPRCAGAFTASARGINDGGTIVGGCTYRKGGRSYGEGVRWQPTSAGTWLPPEVITPRTPCYGCGIARGINNAGEIVGENGLRPFIWTQGKGLQYLDVLLSGGDGTAYAVTDAEPGVMNRIVGHSSANGAASRPRAVWWP